MPSAVTCMYRDSSAHELCTCGYELKSLAESLLLAWVPHNTQCHSIQPAMHQLCKRSSRAGNAHIQTRKLTFRSRWGWHQCFNLQYEDIPRHAALAGKDCPFHVHIGIVLQDRPCSTISTEL